jgi:hypothetical protein
VFDLFSSNQPSIVTLMETIGHNTTKIQTTSHGTSIRSSQSDGYLLLTPKRFILYDNHTTPIFGVRNEANGPIMGAFHQGTLLWRPRQLAKPTLRLLDLPEH